MERFLDWWKREERYVTLIKSLLLLLLPLACCVAYCGAQGHWIGDVYLPSSQWNDELFYYKQVEGILSHGYPQGYFGFNESHALKLSFAAWSPVLVFPWVIWGLLFGWNLASPVICNIVIMSLCCFLFVWLVRPSWKQLGVLAFLFCVYTPFARYMLSAMPEVTCFSLLILFHALTINYMRRERAWKLVLLFLLAGVMTLMRPYFLLFLPVPAVFWIRKNGWKGAVGSLAVSIAVLGIYACIKHYLGADYFESLYFTDWVLAFSEQGVVGGARYTVGKLLRVGKNFMEHLERGISEGLASGAIFAGYFICLCVLVLQSVKDAVSLRRLRKERTLSETREEDIKNGTDSRDSGQIGTVGSRLAIEAYLAFSFVVMLFALLLMYKLTEGSKHLLTFMAAAIFMIAVMDTRLYKKAIVVGVTFFYLYSYMAVDPYDYQVPYIQEERVVSLKEWTEVFAKNLSLEQENTPNYDNVVIWIFNDDVEGTTVNTSWQVFYALPEGFGISCCMREYVMQNFDVLHSKYLCTVSGGTIDDRCRQAGYVKIAQIGDTVLYQRY